MAGRAAVTVFAVLSLMSCASLGGALTEDFRRAVVLTWNMHAGRDAERRDNLVRVATTIRQSGADLVLLQEVDRNTERSGRADQLAILERLTGFYGRFGKTLDYQGGDYGIAVLSRWPIVRDSMVALRVEPPSVRAGGSREPRGMLHVVVAAPAGEIHLLNTHLDAAREDSARRQEVAQVATFARLLRETGYIVIAGGDLNAEPDTPIIDAMRSAGLLDLWTACGVGPGLTYPSRDAIKRIDYLFAIPELHCEDARVLEEDASDHRALRIVVRFAGGG